MINATSEKVPSQRPQNCHWQRQQSKTQAGDDFMTGFFFGTVVGAVLGVLMVAVLLGVLAM
jgi:tetrahydromethanopterin S-methyltransferase subunit B